MVLYYSHSFSVAVPLSIYFRITFGFAVYMNSHRCLQQDTSNICLSFRNILRIHAKKFEHSAQVRLHVLHICNIFSASKKPCRSKNKVSCAEEINDTRICSVQLSLLQNIRQTAHTQQTLLSNSLGAEAHGPCQIR